MNGEKFLILLVSFILVSMIGGLAFVVGWYFGTFLKWMVSEYGVVVTGLVYAGLGGVIVSVLLFRDMRNN